MSTKHACGPNCGEPTPAAYDARWQDETLADLQETARRIVRQTKTCKCPDEKHHNLLHDLAADLLRVFPPGSGEA